MKTAIIGHTGYVGMYLRTKVKGADLYNSKNIQDIQNKAYDVVYCAGLPATKWLVNKDPATDENNMLFLQDCFSKCTIQKFVLISTIDVYDKNILHQHEDDTDFTQEPYGRNRRKMEEWVIAKYNNHHVIRLPALFGFGLKKNALYDLMNKNMIYKINPLDMFQWYYVDDLWMDIARAVASNRRILNLFNEPLYMKEIIMKMFSNCDLAVQTQSTKYDFHTKYGIYTHEKEYILDCMHKFVHDWMFVKERGDQLVVSNLCWQDEEMALHVLKRYGIKNLELALTKYGTWENIDLNAIKARFEGFTIYSLQALFYGKDCNMFDNPRSFVSHFKTVIDIAKKLGVKRLVFGSPSNRRVTEGITPEDSKYLFTHIFKKLAAYLPEDMQICIEHNAVQYNCNMLNYTHEVVDILRSIDHPNITLNLDTGNAAMMQETYDFKTILPHIGHAQISAPFLADIETLSELGHTFTGFTGKISMESKPCDNFETSLLNFINLIRF